MTAWYMAGDFRRQFSRYCGLLSLLRLTSTCVFAQVESGRVVGAIRDFSEEWNLQFRAEAFNLFNTPEFGIPAATVDVSGVAGSITSTIHSSRQVQLALKLNF